MVNLNRFYTYAYLRVDRSPYYIEKGQRGRAYQGKGKPCRVPKDKTRIIFLKQNLTEEESFRHEIYMIMVFGRKDLGTGILRNKTDGGEGCSGLIVREESKRKQSQKMKGKYVGKKWWNDNCGNNKFSIECPGEGWVLGLDNKKSKELGLGIHSLTTEQLSETGKKVASQRWECLETGFTTNAGNLTQYQRARGIDTSKRKRVS